MIESDGWYLKRQKGSHKIYRHATKPGVVIIAGHRPKDEVPPGTLNSILKQAGLK